MIMMVVVVLIEYEETGLNINYFRLIIFAAFLCWLPMTPQSIIGVENSSFSTEDREACMYGSGQKAVKACEWLLKSTPESLSILLKQADHLLELQRIDDAEIVVDKAMKFHPSSKKAIHKSKEIESYQQERKWAQKNKENKDNSSVTNTLSPQLRLDQIRCLKLKGEKALQACNNIIYKESNNSGLYKARGKILAEMGREEEAERDFKLAMKYGPAYQKLRPTLVGKKESLPPGNSSVIVADKPVLHITAKEKKILAVETEVVDASGSNDLAGKMALLQSLLQQSFIDEDEYGVRKKRLLDAAFTTTRDESDATTAAVTANLLDMKDLGRYHALVIGVQDYQNLPKLKTARKDADDIALILQEHYGFKVKKLLNATRRGIILALKMYRNTLEFNDNLLIYYAGHGWLDKEADAGYWLPAEAESDNDVDWVSLSTLTSAVRAIEAKHVMVVADSCFSGKLTRGIHITRKTPSYFSRIAKKRARVVLTSGGLEPVLDSGGRDGHSVFADAFLQALRENEGIMDGATLFTKIRRPVMIKADQTPEYSDIRRAGHEGGDFIFQRVRR